MALRKIGFNVIIRYFVILFTFFCGCFSMAQAEVQTLVNDTTFEYLGEFNAIKGEVVVSRFDSLDSVTLTAKSGTEVPPPGKEIDSLGLYPDPDEGLEDSGVGEFDILVVGYKDDTVNVIKTNEGAGKTRITAKDIETVSQECFTDITTVLATLPEISTAGDFSAVTYVRGTDRVSYYVNGVPIIYPYRWAGYLTTINPYYVDYVDVFTGRVPELFHNALSGVYNIHYNEKPSDSLRGVVDLGAETNVLLTVPIGPTSITVGYRRSLYDLFANLAINEIDIEGQDLVDSTFNFPFFEDYYGNVSYNINDEQSLALNISFNSEMALTQYGDGIYDSSSVLSLNHTWKLHDNFTLYSTIGRNFHKQFSDDEEINSVYIDDIVPDYYFEEDFVDSSLAKRNGIEETYGRKDVSDTSHTYTNMFYKLFTIKEHLHYSSGDVNVDGGFSIEDYAYNEYLKYDDRIARYNTVMDSSFTFSGFSGVNYTFNQLFQAGVSLRIDYMDRMITSKIFYNPEFNFSFDVKERGYFNGVLSMVEKEPRIFGLFNYFANYNLEPERAYHSTLSYEKIFGERVKLKSSLYYSFYENLINSYEEHNKESSNYKGVSITASRKRGAYTRFDGYVSYTLGESLYNTNASGLEKEFPSAFDFRHSLKIGANVVMIKNKSFIWESKNKIIYQSATPFHNIGKHVRSELSDIVSPGYDIFSTSDFDIFGRPEEGTFRWDTGLYFTFPKLLNLIVYVQSLNVTSTNNVDSYEVEDVYNDKVRVLKYYSPFASRFYIGGLRVSF